MSDKPLRHIPLSEQVNDELFAMQPEELRDFTILLIDAIEDIQKLEDIYYGVVARDGTGAAWQNLRQAGALDDYDAALEELNGMAS